MAYPFLTNNDPIEFVFKFYTPFNCYDLPQLERFHVTNPLQLFTLSKEKKNKLRPREALDSNFANLEIMLPSISS